MFGWLKSKTKLKNSVPNTVELCSIIESGDKHNVAVMKFGDVVIRFVQKFDSNASVIAHESLHLPRPSTEIPGPDHETQTRDAILSDEIRVKADRLAQMILEDPAEAERIILGEDLDDADPDADDDSEPVSQ